MDSWDRELRNMDREHQMAYTQSTTNLTKGTNMSNQYVDMRIKESKKGNKYLSGKLKGTETIFMVMKDKEGRNTLSFKESFDGELTDIDKFTAKEGNFGPYEFAKNANTGEVYFLTAREDAGQPVFNKAGEPIMKFNSEEQLLSADFTLKIMPAKEG
jgi:hypothetical protein